MPRPTATEDVFRAVADPTRRQILQALGQRTDIPVTELAELLDVSVPMLSRHLAVLRAAGLVAEHRDGRQRRYYLNPQPLRELYDWAGLFAGFWTERIDNLRDYLNQQGKE